MCRWGLNSFECHDQFEFPFRTGYFECFFHEILQSFGFWNMIFRSKWASENRTSYNVFTTFDVDLRKALCDGTWFVERAHIANTKSNIDQFSNRFSTFCLQKRYHWYSCNHFCHFLTFPISLSVIRFLGSLSQ